MATNGLLLGASWARPAITSLGSKAILFVKSPLGRHILKKSVLASGGLAGIAAIAAITASLIYQKAGPLPAGVLQGSPLSPLLANIYLHLFDLMMVRRQHALVRFADDWVAFAPTYQDADHAYRQAEWALGRLRLDLNPEKTRIRHADEKVQWLGGAIP
jgi:RNA-directed DNA polymerase